MIIQLKGLLDFEIRFPKKRSGLEYDEHLMAPNEQRWLRTCRLQDYLIDKQKSESLDHSTYNGHLISDIKVVEYEIYTNQSEVWEVSLRNFK